ncbi:MAG: holo-[acyl-carrier-protein] synthase [Tenericutes bacterium GWC2_34_14]|nr:MAG: holo-[acyl-carrier-protein] synthase [Tenericutes bacterium GWA2_35_7]OHE28155.1 MAG: holo-[acyl-carrier-protein] synthase [Tenericutes bacterium GWC2_34_14]OHE32905.1 MAG: holo-[acyl-carrier-protein] synthase [Tenericutes bacterium GWE2_34_108]OHE36130.1 MAG: holo-[acyl-carrier-protein] synthase [Tenericutes bacterium GWF1_35_14]OHE39353.1 MAG: holo-[acyl-carrier-protein] synthase [Tenericutes bacterium GWF2_35_184]OHE43835.1 MAG: holo-[acyl-carrier-protein] synthase [Tenericutes bact
MIIGIGIDLVELDRLKELMSDRFIDRILSPEEKKQYLNIAAENTKLSFIGGRFAAKEALFKAISKGNGTAYYRDFSILNYDHGQPYVETDFFKDDEIIHLSITHTDHYAMAYVMIEKV